jgi:FkbM family methyltransferase
MNIITNNNNIYGVEIQSYDDYIYKHSIEANRLWDEEVVNEILNNYKENTDILDIGANIGLVTLGVIKKAQECGISLQNIHSFECDPTTFTLLANNTSKYTSVKLYPFAVAHKELLCNLTRLPKNLGTNHIYNTIDENKQEKYDYSSLFYVSAHEKRNNIFILGTSLDNIQYTFKSPISVMKIDVEGFEVNVLNGAKNLILRDRPTIIVEIYEQINLEAVQQFFIQVNYRSYKKLLNSVYTSQDYVFYPN